MKVMGCPAFSGQSNNPYCSLLYRAMQKKGIDVVEFPGLWRRVARADIFHVHWPDMFLHTRSWPKAFLKAARFLAVVALLRLQGGRIVWTAHNLQSHENFHPRLEFFFWWCFIRQVDGVISLSEAGLAQVREKRLGSRKIPTACIPHGHYQDWYPNEIEPSDARRNLGISDTAFVAGWIGQIRAYKGLPELVAAWRKGAGTDRALLIAGHSSDPALEKMLEEQASQDETIHFHPGRVEDPRLQYYFKASDVVILPYRKILNSGSALLGLSFDRPVALPKSAVMRELQNQVGADWVYLYEGEFDADVLQKICAWAKSFTRLTKAPLSSLDWDLLADKTTDFFRRLSQKS